MAPQRLPDGHALKHDDRGGNLPAAETEGSPRKSRNAEVRQWVARHL
jgi:hypothetical protein